MFTYDNLKDSLAETGLDELFMRRSMPHVMEVGETCDYWVFVNRKSKGMELMSKVNGDSIKCTFSEATRHGISEGQIRAAKDALSKWPLEEAAQG